MGWLAEGGKKAGERRVGIIRRWTVSGGEEAISWVMDWRMEGNGFSAVREMGVKLMLPVVGSDRRLVKSKLWQNGVGTVEPAWPGLDGIEMRFGAGVAVDVSSLSVQHIVPRVSIDKCLIYTDEGDRSRVIPPLDPAVPTPNSPSFSYLHAIFIFS